MRRADIRRTDTRKIPPGPAHFSSGHNGAFEGIVQGVKRQVKDWQEEHPRAYGELMDTLLSRAQGRYVVTCPHCHQTFKDTVVGDSEAARYIIDRIKGKPRQQTELDIKGGERLPAAYAVAVFQLFTDKQKQIEAAPGDDGGHETD